MVAQVGSKILKKLKKKMKKLEKLKSFTYAMKYIDGICVYHQLTKGERVRDRPIICKTLANKIAILVFCEFLSALYHPKSPEMKNLVRSLPRIRGTWKNGIGSRVSSV